MSLLLPSFVMRTWRPPQLASGLLLAVAATVPHLPAQQVQVVAPVGVLAPPARGAGDDVGTPVEMFENPNLDRYMRKAQSFLDAADYTAAIEVLQDVIEGRTVEVVAARPEEQSAAAAAPGAQPDTPVQTDPGAAAAARAAARNRTLDARNSVFSHDGRVYRPVRRLCHELLARMPEIGIEIYRTRYEVAAEELLREAERDGATTALERVANRYFVTLPSGRAMHLLADRLMHEGRYRSAVQVLRDLLDVYPAANRQRLGISEVWCRFKIALCLRLAGEFEAAHALVEELAERHPQESLRILGQLESIRDLPKSELFARDVVAVASADERRRVSWLDADTDALVPLWQYRFSDPEPYRDPKPSGGRERTIWFDGGVEANAMPYADRYGPATRVAFDVVSDRVASVPRALFLEHYRLREADAAYGLLLRESDGVDQPPVARENHPRVRIAACDFALLRPVEDAERRYVVHGHRGNTSGSAEVLKASELIAYRRDDWQRAWSSEQWLDGDDGLRGVTFLSAPTVFGERLLLPALRRDAYTLECLDRGTGRPLWHTLLHGGGTPFFKAPGCPVVVSGGIALVATNAGCLAAVDAFAGDLRWIRRYERDDPIHSVPKPSRRAGRGDMMGMAASYQFPQLALGGFWPNDLFVHDGLVTFAPCDGDLLMSLDVANGQPVWMLDASTRYAPYGRLRTIVGATAKRMFLTSDTHLVAIDLDGGLVRWCRELPQYDGQKEQGRGRGAIAGSWVVLPGVRELLVFDVDGAGPMRRLPLSSFGESREPLAGSCDVVVDGPWLAVGRAGGVEVYSTRTALRELAGTTAEPLRRAFYLTEAGEPDQAESVLAAAIHAATDHELRETAGFRLLALVRARAAALARSGDLAAALAALDSVRELLDERRVRLDWHLVRIELCKDVGDLRAHEREQQRLYDYMEGSG